MTATSGAAHEPETSRRSPLASGSVSEHLLRGAGGLLAGVLAVLLLGIVGPVSLVLLALTAIAWRGCPTCWTVGLLGTVADGHACRSLPPRADTPTADSD
jgi:hypothetical protein